MVINAGFYNPMLLARDVVSADICTGGRIEVGLGTGFTPAEFDKIGVPYLAPGGRIDHLISTIATLRDFCSDPDEPSPVQQPCPPILIAAGRPRMVRTAVEHADIIALSGGYLDASGAIHMVDAGQLAERIHCCDEHATKLGRTPERNIHVYHCAVGDDRAAALEDIAREDNAAGLTPAQLGELPTVLAGRPADIVSQLREHRERFGITYYSIPDIHADAFGAVLRRLGR